MAGPAVTGQPASTAGPRRPGWASAAACRGQATGRSDPWHPEDGNWDQGRAACAGCPVRADCLADGLRLLGQAGQVEGMWGGLTPAELRRAAAARGLPTRKQAQHGTRPRYTAGCRCGPCRAANARYRAAQAAS
jgi:WhiB family transcriptional regulator, redox-sensing transcriptional regulator